MTRKSKRQRTTDSPGETRNLSRWWRPGCLSCATALLVATPLIPSERTELTGAALPFVMLWLLLTLVWFAGAAIFDVRLGRLGWIDAAMLALVGWHAISGLVMMHYGAPRPTINAIWTWVSFAVIVVLLRQLLRSQLEARALCAVMIGIAVCLSVMASYQTVVTHPNDRAFYEADPDKALRQANVHAPKGSALRKQFEARLYSGEPTATFSLTNSLAGYLAPWLIMLLGIAAASGFRVQESGVNSQAPTARAVPFFFQPATRFWIAFIVSGTLVAICLLLTKSRTAWLATIFGCAGIAAVILWLFNKRKILLLAAGGFACLIVVAGMLSFLNIIPTRFADAAALSLKYRLEYWQSTAAMIGDYPLLGCGPGNFQDYYTTYKLPQASETIADPHNFVFEIASHAGLPALLIMVGLLVLVAMTAWRAKGEGASTTAEDADADTLDEPSHTRVCLGVYGGVLLGVLLANYLGLVVQQPVDFFPLLLGGTCGVIALWLTHDWVLHGRLPRWLPPLVIAVLLINLLAAGGISFPGVAMTLWVLIAVMTFGAPARHWRPSPVAALVMLTPAIVGLLMSCYLSAYQPVLRRQRLMEYALSSDPNDNYLHLARTAEADPWSAQPHLLLARMVYDYPLRGSFEDTVRRCRQHCKQAIHLDAHSHQTISAAAYIHLIIAEDLDDNETYEQAAKYFERAVQLYPNDAMAHARLALTYYQFDRAKAKGPAEEAMRLDALCPHEERKLANRPIFGEISLARFNDPFYQGIYSAEQRMLQIRNDSVEY